MDKRTHVRPASTGTMPSRNPTLRRNSLPRPLTVRNRSGAERPGLCHQYVDRPPSEIRSDRRVFARCFNEGSLRRVVRSVPPPGSGPCRIGAAQADAACVDSDMQNRPLWMDGWMDGEPPQPRTATIRRVRNLVNVTAGRLAQPNRAVTWCMSASGQAITNGHSGLFSLAASAGLPLLTANCGGGLVKTVKPGISRMQSPIPPAARCQCSTVASTRPAEMALSSCW
jgi:hypothetical protein